MAKLPEERHLKKAKKKKCVYRGRDPPTEALTSGQFHLIV